MSQRWAHEYICDALKPALPRKSYQNNWQNAGYINSMLSTAQLDPYVPSTERECEFNPCWYSAVRWWDVLGKLRQIKIKQLVELGRAIYPAGLSKAFPTIAGVWKSMRTHLQPMQPSCCRAVNLDISGRLIRGFLWRFKLIKPPGSISVGMIEMELLEASIEMAFGFIPAGKNRMFWLFLLNP